MERLIILEGFSKEHDNMLNILHALQNNNPDNYLCEEDLKAVADHLNTTYSHVYGVAKYYTMFSLKPRGRHIIRLCKSPVCNMEQMGGIASEIMKILSIGINETTADKRFTLELSECLGLCATAPSMMIDEEVYGDLTPNELEPIFAKYK